MQFCRRILAEKFCRRLLDQDVMVPFEGNDHIDTVITLALHLSTDNIYII